MDDNDREHETPPTPPVEEEPKPPTAPAEDASLRQVVERLEATVSGLAAQVANMAPLPGRDETPTSRPWTHRG